MSRSERVRPWASALPVLLAALLHAPSACAQQVNEAELKAAFVVNFISFVTWPAQRAPAGTVRLCVRAGSSLQHVLGELDGRRTGDHVLVLKVLATPAEADDCHLVIADFPQQPPPELAGISAHGLLATDHDPISGGPTPFDRPAALAEPWPEGWWRRPGVLSIADGGDSARNGTVITLVRDGTRIRFEIDSSTADEAGLSLSSKLLRLAKAVL